MARPDSSAYLPVMDTHVEAFVERWLRDNAGIIAEIVTLQASDPSTPYGAALAAYLAEHKPEAGFDA